MSNVSLGYFVVISSLSAMATFLAENPVLSVSIIECEISIINTVEVCDLEICFRMPGHLPAYETFNAMIDLRITDGFGKIDLLACSETGTVLSPDLPHHPVRVGTCGDRPFFSSFPKISSRLFLYTLFRFGSDLYLSPFIIVVI